MLKLINICAALALSLGTTAAHGKTQIKRIEGTPAIGTNLTVSGPIADFGAPFFTASFYNLGVLNPHGAEPLVIDAATPSNATLATAVDPFFLSLLGLPEGIVDPEMLNIPLHEVGANVSPFGDARAPLPSTLDVDPSQPSQAQPVDSAITLDDWMGAEGSAFLYCKPNGYGVKLRLKYLLPNRMYTVWGVFDAEGQMIATPLGGAPNVFVSNSRGNAWFSRELGFCPFETTEAGSKLLAIDVLYHSDHQVYGAVPDLPLVGLVTGTITHTHLEFTVSGKTLSP